VTRTDDAYGWQSRFYDVVLEPMNAPLRRVARRLVDLPPGGVVLDVGCGTGAALAEYRDEGHRVLGCDPSPGMLDRARERLGGAPELRPSTGTRIPFEDGCADLVLLSLVLHSLAPDEARELLADAWRVLAPGGRVLVTDFGVAGLRVPRGVALRGVTVLAELAAGPRHAGHAWAFVRGGGLPALVGPGWDLEREKHTAGGNVTVTVLARS
jgi:ubiquinone/menaquinone biosynthesis C-methylase UbiE